MKKRKYTQKRRAVQHQQTRERIVDAAMALHEELGPAATTISALAKRAGGQRLTVYRHFSNDEELFEACTGKWFGINPPPAYVCNRDDDPEDCTHAYLLSLYRYYRRTENMWSAAYRDVESVPALTGPMREFDEHLAAIAKKLALGWKACKSKQLLTTLRHAVRFTTWRSLSDQKLSDKAMADLVCTWVQCVSQE